MQEQHLKEITTIKNTKHAHLIQIKNMRRDLTIKKELATMISIEFQQIKQMVLDLKIKARDQIHNMEAKITTRLQGLHTHFVHISAID